MLLGGAVASIRMKKFILAFFINIVFIVSAFSQITDLKCIWTSGFTNPPEDLSSFKDKVEFYKIDLFNKIILDSPSGEIKNAESSTYETYVIIDEETIMFGEEQKNGALSIRSTIDRNTGQLTRTFNVKVEPKNYLNYEFLCEKTKIKKKF